MSGRALLELFHHPLKHLPRRLVARMMQNLPYGQRQDGGGADTIACGSP